MRKAQQEECIRNVGVEGEVVPKLPSSENSVHLAVWCNIAQCHTMQAHDGRANAKHS